MIIYRCPGSDGGLIKAEKCVENCPMGKRCVPKEVAKWGIIMVKEYKDEKRWSVTSLLRTPLQAVLERMVALGEVDLVRNPRHFARPFFGSFVHLFLKKFFAKGIKERKYVVKVDGFKISGVIDLLADGVVTDYKIVSPEFIEFFERKRLELKEEWVKQVWFYMYILSRKGKEIKGGKVILVSPMQSEKPFWLPVDISLPNLSEVEREIIERARERYHYWCRHKELGEYPPICDVWGYKRCEEYCFYNSICPYYQATSLFFKDFKSKEVKKDEEIYPIIQMYLEAKEKVKKNEKVAEECKNDIERYMIERKISRLIVGDKVLELSKETRQVIDKNLIPPELLSQYSRWTEYLVLRVKGKRNEA